MECLPGASHLPGALHICFISFSQCLSLPLSGLFVCSLAVVCVRQCICVGGRLQVCIGTHVALRGQLWKVDSFLIPWDQGIKLRRVQQALLPDGPSHQLEFRQSFEVNIASTCHHIQLDTGFTKLLLNLSRWVNPVTPAGGRSKFNASLIYTLSSRTAKTTSYHVTKHQSRTE